jgi:hypothetical protein
MKKNFIIRFVSPDSLEYYDVLVPREGEGGVRA